jgi:hypothetical protein
MSSCSSSSVIGSIISLVSSEFFLIDFCVFQGDLFVNEETMKNKQFGKNEESNHVCSWDGSLLSLSSSSGTIKESTISHSSKGGLSIDGGDVIIEKGEFEENDPSIERYLSFRRNIICSSGRLDVKSLKGGDGIQNGSSLFILSSSECSLKGITKERNLFFFISTLDNITNATEGSLYIVTNTDSGKGVLSVERGNVRNVKGEFENNNPRFKLFPSFRRNIV